MNMRKISFKILILLLVLFGLTLVGAKTQTYAATKKTINVKTLNIVVNNDKYAVYNGTVIKPSVKVYNGSKKLKVDKDYKVIYGKRVTPGKTYVTIQGIGNYTGKVKKAFYIVPKSPELKEVTFSSNSTKATIKWNKDKRADGYKIYMAESENGTYTRIRTFEDNTVTSYTKKGLDPNKIYYFKIRAYKIIDGKKCARPYSAAKSNTGLIATVTLNSPNSGWARNCNLQRACEIINGKIIKPGETFNWFRDHGQASASRGFKQAIVFQGNKQVLGSGGGVCQVSSTIYQAARNAGLQIVERHIHSQPVSYTTLGNDATVYYGVDNLIIRNNKQYTIKLVTSSNGGSTTCKIYRVL